MTGVIKQVLQNKNYGFIFNQGTTYFFHREDFNGHWEDLLMDHLDSTIHVVFEPIPNPPKGMRARNVHRIDWPNEG